MFVKPGLETLISLNLTGFLLQVLTKLNKQRSQHLIAKIFHFFKGFLLLYVNSLIDLYAHI